jgi:3-phenylpropionate/trans-cinnamate dioxygenase ferredoxin subunit
MWPTQTGHRTGRVPDVAQRTIRARRRRESSNQRDRRDLDDDHLKLAEELMASVTGAQSSSSVLGAAVARCLYVTPADRREQLMSDVQIQALENGPYKVEGPVTLTDADGSTYETRTTSFLCRCGGSTKKPFCDGTHSKIAFDAAERAVRESGCD